MSGLERVEDYAVILIWLGIFSFYTTLLTVTALGVVFILRKRRSSILKSQRPPRTPFSELEFHVATPTDTAKSRRVSFSRRTGVAEFITNEATTTWKTFYEEHNKSLESSGNDSSANPPKPTTVGHLGKRIFDQQFQEVEAVDFITSLDNHSGRIVNTSMNKVNFTQQLASLECTGGDKSLLAPQRNFDMSSFTDHQSNVFGEELALPTMGEASDKIDVNFSAIQAIGSSEIKDDLDQIQEDLMRAKSNVFCPGPFNGRTDLSEYIEVDLNSTSAIMKNDASDMSITDIIYSPKVQEVSKSSSIKINKSACKNDWVADKENIAIVDGCSPPVKTSEKRKTIVYENETGNISITQALPVNIILPQKPKTSERRRTIVYESDSADISVTQAVPVNIVIVNQNKEKRKTIIYENETGNISVTQAIPSNIILPDKARTIVADDEYADISITQAIPIAKIITNSVTEVSHKSVITEERMSNISDKCEEQKTIVCGYESLDVSHCNNISNFVRLNHEMNKESRLEFEPYSDIAYSETSPVTNSEFANNSYLKECSVKIELSHSGEVTDKKIPLEDNAVTETVSKNVVSLKQNEFIQKRTPSVSNDSSHIEHKQEVSVNLVLVNGDRDKLNTIINENETDSESITQTMSSNIILPDKIDTILSIEDFENISTALVIPDEKIIPRNISENSHESVVTKLKETGVEFSDKENVIIDETESVDTSYCNNMSIPKPIDNMAKEYLPPKPVRLSNDVIKKLHFEDESTSETSVKSNNKSIGELRKTTLIQEIKPKTRSIRDISEIKLLMNNLTNSNIDVIPLSSTSYDNVIPSDPSTCSTQIQTDLTSSSQIDLHNEESNFVFNTSCKIPFEDKSTSETSVKPDIQSSPLKKPVFEEISYVKESKTKVIPGYLKDVSYELKALMTDLIKPNADVIPFAPTNKSKVIPEIPSTCSTQIQANLITSSQIDIDIGQSNSASASFCNIENNMSRSTASKSLKSSLKSPKIVHLPETSICSKLTSPCTTMSGKVIVFDQNNPLNNVLLVPPDCSNVHRYEPRLNEDSVERTTPTKDMEKASIGELQLSHGKNITQFNVENIDFPRSLTQVRGTDKVQVTESYFSNTSKSTSAPEYEQVHELKDSKVNTLIAMKENKELLETSSSLTLVDDAITSNNCDADSGPALEKVRSPSSSDKTKSPLKIIYQNDEQDSCKNKASVHTPDKDTEELEKFGIKAKKRNYSPTKRNQHEHSDLTSVDNTPKQISKIQKLSTSPNPYKPERETYKLEAERDYQSHEMDVDTSMNINDMSQSKNRQNKSPQKTKLGSDITVQQLITEYELQENIDQHALNKHILEALSKSGSAANTSSVTDVSATSPEMASSFTSSKNQIEMQEAFSVTTTDTKSSSRSARSDWRMDSNAGTALLAECDSSVNVVAKIDMLPFMGSYECEWEPSGSDTWAFRLLHGRLRLTVRLAHRHDNATRTRVRADTPVLAVNLDIVHADKPNSVAALCVRFAAEAMRQYVGRGCGRAGGVVALIRRCAALARLATRWGRALHDARLHLAYTLHEDTLVLKVANIPLRSVWEVTMRLHLVTDEAVPFPRASDVKVARVVSDVKITDVEVNKLLATLPRDWGHVPRAIWKIFRYLKNKTRDDLLLGLS